MASTIKVNNIQNQCGANIINESANTITIGASGDTITLACGASQTGFGRTGTVDWDTTAKTASFTAVSGNGYFVNTTSAAITVTLPASPSAGDIVAVSDYASTAQTNNILVTPNGTDKINGVNAPYYIQTQGLAVTLVYVDATKGWKSVTGSDADATGIVPAFITATGGTVTCCGDYKIHTFTGPGTFTVCSVGNAAGSNKVDYLVIAGGGAGGGSNGGGGGGGAGGFRLSNSTNMPAPLTSPLANSAGLPVSATSYPITIGGGGSGGTGNAPPVAGFQGGDGNNSIFSTITSSGGGGGGGANPNGTSAGRSGGSGGGEGGMTASGGPGAGNTPAVSPPQGNPGGDTTPALGTNQGSGGGGAGASGAGNGPGFKAGDGGIGGYVVSSGFAGSNGTTGPVCGARYFSGGGGANSEGQPISQQGVGGAGGGTDGVQTANSSSSAAANTGGGSGGIDTSPSGLTSGNGGSGIVIIRYKYQ
jgi:hypothetical protein